MNLSASFNSSKLPLGLSSTYPYSSYSFSSSSFSEIANQFIVSQIPVDQLISVFRVIIREELQHQKEIESSEKILSVKDVCEFLDVSRATVSNWTRDKKIQGHYIEGRVFYKKGELLNSLNPIKKY